MEALILLATVMALFGVLGYLRGAKSSLLTAVVIWLSLILISQAKEVIAKTVNGLNFAVRFVLAGGLGALGGGGDRGAALEEVINRVGTVKPLVNPDGTGIGMVLVFLLLVAVGFLLGMLKIFRSRASLWGLLIGLANGYVLSAFLLPRLLPEAGFSLWLPGTLVGPASRGVVTAPAPRPSVTGALIDRLMETLSALVSGGQIAMVIALLIVIFVLLATRRGSRGK